MPESVTAEKSGGVGWSAMFEVWAFIESGFDSVYRVDLSSVKVRRSRSWRWFRVRLAGLMAADTPLSRTLAPREQPQEPAETEFS